MFLFYVKWGDKSFLNFNKKKIIPSQLAEFKLEHRSQTFLYYIIYILLLCHFTLVLIQEVFIYVGLIPETLSYYLNY